LGRADAGGGEESAEVLGLGGEIGQRRNRERLGGLAADAVLAAADLAAFHRLRLFGAGSSLAIRPRPFRNFGCRPADFQPAFLPAASPRRRWLISEFDRPVMVLTLAAGQEESGFRFPFRNNSSLGC